MTIILSFIITIILSFNKFSVCFCTGTKRSSDSQPDDSNDSAKRTRTSADSEVSSREPSTSGQNEQSPTLTSNDAPTTELDTGLHAVPCVPVGDSSAPLTLESINQVPGIYFPAGFRFRGTNETDHPALGSFRGSSITTNLQQSNTLTTITNVDAAPTSQSERPLGPAEPTSGVVNNPTVEVEQVVTTGTNAPLTEEQASAFIDEGLDALQDVGEGCLQHLSEAVVAVEAARILFQRAGFPPNRIADACSAVLIGGSVLLRNDHIRAAAERVANTLVSPAVRTLDRDIHRPTSPRDATDFAGDGPLAVDGVQGRVPSTSPQREMMETPTTGFSEGGILDTGMIPSVVEKSPISHVVMDASWFNDFGVQTVTFLLISIIINENKAFLEQKCIYLKRFSPILSEFLLNCLNNPLISHGTRVRVILCVVIWFIFVFLRVV